MKGLLLLLLVPLALMGCGDGDGTDTTAGGTPAPTTPETTILAQGTKTASGTTILASVSVEEPGILTGTVTWSGAPTNMTSGFLQVVSSLYHGVTVGGSPLTSTVTVTDTLVAAGHDWQFFVSNSGPDVDATYVVQFTPD